ncbi:hypothetical protein EV291_1774 [Rhizobium sp. BK068]|nr:hypothetical protein [Rhizobium sp. BK060]TCM59716.1 hypothetical protein EV291_1774 [Rhizobium sp. BK068]
MLAHRLLIGIRGEEFAKGRDLGMAFLLICHHEFCPQLSPKRYQKLVHIVIEALALGLCPKTRARRVEWVEVTSVPSQRL